MGIHLYCCISNGKGGLMNDGKHEYSQSISERKEQRGNEKTVNFFCANDRVYINFIWSCCYRCNRKYVYHSYHPDNGYCPSGIPVLLFHAHERRRSCNACCNDLWWCLGRFINNGCFVAYYMVVS